MGPKWRFNIEFPLGNGENKRQSLLTKHLQRVKLVLNTTTFAGYSHQLQAITAHIFSSAALAFETKCCPKIMNSKRGTQVWTLSNVENPFVHFLIFCLFSSLQRCTEASFGGRLSLHPASTISVLGSLWRFPCWRADVMRKWQEHIRHPSEHCVESYWFYISCHS